MCKFTYLAFFYYAPFFVLQYPLTVCIEPLNFTLPSSKVQANCKQENGQKTTHTHSVYFRFKTIATPNFTKCKNTSLKIM